MATAQQPHPTLSLTITPRAVEEVLKSIAAEQVPDETAGLRISVLPGGCSGFKYELSVEERSQDDDLVIESNGLRLFVDTFSAQYLAGIEVDYVRTFQSAGFTFNNPNATGGCGCGESFSV